MASKHATSTQIVQIHNALLEHFDKEAGRYRNDMSDRLLIELLGLQELSHNSVKRIRYELGFRIKEHTQHTSATVQLLGELELKILSLTSRIEALEQKIANGFSQEAEPKVVRSEFVGSTRHKKR